MLEILGLVARMPIVYRRIRKAELKLDYENHLQNCRNALGAFHLLIEEKNASDVSDEALMCYNAVVQAAEERNGLRRFDQIKIDTVALLCLFSLLF